MRDRIVADVKLSYLFLLNTEIFLLKLFIIEKTELMYALHNETGEVGSSNTVRCVIYVVEVTQNDEEFRYITHV